MHTSTSTSYTIVYTLFSYCIPVLFNTYVWLYEAASLLLQVLLLLSSMLQLLAVVLHQRLLTL
jgi:hypothetical protein